MMEKIKNFLLYTLLILFLTVLLLILRSEIIKSPVAEPERFQKGGYQDWFSLPRILPKFPKIINLNLLHR